MFTTMFRAGRFWIVDSVSFQDVVSFPSFGSFREAREALGTDFVDPDLA